MTLQTNWAESDPCTQLSVSLRKHAELREQLGHSGRSPVTSYRASEAGKCLRQIWYRVSGYAPAPQDPMKGMAWLAGNAYHDLTRSLMMAHGVPLEGVEFLDDYTQVETDNVYKKIDNITVSCRLDGSWEGDTLVEIKTIGPNAFRYFEKAALEGGNDGALSYLRAKRADFWHQTNVTAGLFERKRIAVVVVDRDGFKIGLLGNDGIRHSVVFAADAGVYNENVKRFQRVESAKLSGTPPRAEFPDGSKECDYCGFYRLCHGAQKGIRSEGNSLQREDAARENDVRPVSGESPG